MEIFSKYFQYLLVVFCLFSNNDQILGVQSAQFEVIHKWQFLNYTWPTMESYNFAVNSKQYIPENNAFTGIKIYQDKIFLSIPRIRPGVPVTLAYISMVKQDTTKNELLQPYPSWEMNIRGDCEALQSVQSMEIDTNGHMWVIDGDRQNEETKCPAKLLILDLKNHGKIIYKHTFPDTIALSKGGYLNDIVLDSTGGGFAYITDSSFIDPGLVVHSLKEKRSWKLRDSRMFADLKATDFKVQCTKVGVLLPIDGIALSPPFSSGEKKLFFSPLTGFNLYAISTRVLKNESFVQTDQWRKDVELIGRKQAQSDGLWVDNDGNLYYTLLTTNGIGKWNVNTPFDTSEIIYRNDKEMIWPDTFAMDEKGFLYVNSNKIYQYLDKSTKLKITSEFKFKIFRYFTGTESYMCYDK